MRARRHHHRPNPALVVRPSPLDKRRAILTLGSLSIPASLGRSGLSVFKREGDGATPIATMKILWGYWRPGRGMRPATRLPLAPIRQNLLWCDQSGHALYNRPSRLPVPASVERMARPDNLYDICIVLDWNLTARARGKGSAIFFHLAKPGFAPTEGCVAIRRADMERLLKAIRPGTRLIVRPC